MTGEARGARWSVGVVIPARDEADRVERCIRSVVAAVERVEALHAAIVVVADACTDATSQRARLALRGRGFVIERRFTSVGRARRAGARALQCWAQLRGIAPSRRWLANTDADSEVPQTWIASQLALADRGAAAVVGTVELRLERDAEVARGRGIARFRRLYRRGFGYGGTHAHVHGANLGVRGDAYRDVGGWPALDSGEDRHLWFRLRARGWPTVSTVDAAVRTSPRLRGRAPDGFAEDLRRLAQARG